MDTSKSSGLASGSAVYSANDICRLFNTNKNSLAALISAGTIPPPLPAPSNGRRLWAKAKIDQILGISNADDASVVELKQIIHAVVLAALNEFAGTRTGDRREHFLKKHDKLG